METRDEARDDLMAAIGHRIRAARRLRDLTQVQLGERVDRHAETVWRWEQGSYAPGAVEMIRLARALDTDVLWLLTGEGTAPRPTAAA